MKEKIKSKWGISALTLILVVSSVWLLNFTGNDTPPEFTITEQNVIEIKEEVQLDSYGFNVIDSQIEEGRVKRNQSLYLILRDLDVSPQTIYEINNKSKGVFQSNRVKPGQRYIVYKESNTSKPYRLILHDNALDYVTFEWGDEIKVTTGQKEVTKEINIASGVITSSLYESLVEKGNNILIANRLSEIFAWQIDFFRLYPGDNYKLIYEKQYVDGKPYGIGDILAAEFEHDGRTYDAYYFEGDKSMGFFDSEGNGVQKALLKAPFKFSQRISSSFNRNRFHPVLKRRMPHNGVDYAAPIGTPVLSVGDGEVTEAQYRGANGNIVKIRHNGTYTTAYLHLNGFARGITPGTRVRQGEVIGYVGKTGRVTGVHLHYMIYKNGQPVNPLNIDLPPSKSIDASERSQFEKMVENLKRKMENDRAESVASVIKEE
ncbi:peptidoglycan DD-metalloendopeptidase family protein [Gracilimonas amylolytica]|uniref:peptidoglycan DD-metalloendopeptidase family protein n=1 Tax=Gracilimonas amylolytica TaxID=1749045 RepID=UPI001E43C3CF|nr:peptidoglycan DD-metalloendopeptidase family protein [Gracilimonas amylolytica]